MIAHHPSGGGLGGDVVGPASAADGSIAVFSGATGKVIAEGLPDNIRQTFNPGATNAGINVGSHAGNPASPVNGDLHYNSTTNKITARVNGETTALAIANDDIIRVLASNETRTSVGIGSATDLTGMSFPVLSGETWDIELIVYARSNTLAAGGGGAAIKTAGPAATWNSGINSFFNTNTSPTLHIYDSGGANGSIYGATTDLNSTIDGTYGFVFRQVMTVLFSASGTFSVQAAQKVSDSDPTTFVRGSKIRARRV